MASAMTRPVIWPSRVPIRVAAVPVLVGGVPLTGKTLCSICQVQSSPGSSADQAMLKLDELVVEDVCARAASTNKRTRARVRKRERRRMIMGDEPRGERMIRGWRMTARTRRANMKKADDAGRHRVRGSFPKGGLRSETGARRGTAHVRVAGERLTNSREGLFHRFLAALERLVECVLAVLEPGEGLGGCADLMIEGFEAGEVDVDAWTGRRDHASPRLGVAGKRAGRLLVGRREAFIVGEGDVELLAQILERAAWAHFGKDMLYAAIGVGGVADLHEDAGRLLPFQRLQRGKNSGPSLGGALDLFGVAPGLHAVGGEDAKLVAQPAGGGSSLGRRGVRRGRGCGGGRGSRAGHRRRLRRGRLRLRPAEIVEDAFDGEPIEEGGRGRADGVGSSGVGNRGGSWRLGAAEAAGQGCGE